MADPLNRDLYTRLVDYYGDVEIVSAGVAMQWQTAQRFNRHAELVWGRQILNPGEEYKVRCKICHDHRARLHINHRWGVWDEEVGSRNLHLIQCFNEQCYADFDARLFLHEKLFGNYVARPGGDVILPGRVAESTVLRPMDPPGQVFKLDDLAKKMPGHPALTYLQGRGFDTDKLAKLYDVGWCADSHYTYANNRIIIPIYQQGMRVGWQARYVGDDVNGLSFNAAKVPKYWTSPGFPRRLAAYNLERALEYKTVIAVEGPFDVWRQGFMCLGAIGKTLSPIVRGKIAEGMKKHGEAGVFVIALDPKQDPEDARRGRPHHIEQLYNQLLQELGGRVVRVYLPDEYDPGSMDRKWFRRLVREAAAELDLKVTFSKPQHSTKNANR